MHLFSYSVQFVSVERHVEQLLQRLPGFLEECQKFSSSAQQVNSRSVLSLASRWGREKYNTVVPPIMDTLMSGQPPYNGHTVHPLPIYCPYISTSEEGTTSEQWAKCSSQTCLFGGSTVYRGPSGCVD